MCVSICVCVCVLLILGSTGVSACVCDYLPMSQRLEELSAMGPVVEKKTVPGSGEP